ncbi:MAG: acyl-CoA dehydrogenase family protein [Candidatus Eremiobacteraeota bacterium]|nr:acyl-CoA dehydrogenase family protein [Candidatus Eremiobacteraeota bacterium]
MDYYLSEELEMIRDLARKIATEMIAPRAAELDEKEEFPWEIINILKESDFMGVYLPEEYGGLGGGILELSVVVEELSRACGGVAVSYAANALGSFPILLFGTEEQKKKYLPDVASGEKLAAFALTESEAGSDAGNVKTTAKKDGDFYVLNGRKQWITNGGEADVYTVIASVKPNKGARGLSAFIVEKDTPGFSFGKKEKKMGIRCSSTRELIFEDCRIPAENLLGLESRGFMVAMKTLDMARPGVAAQAIGIAQGALDHAIAFGMERVQFGHAITTYQAIKHKIAECSTRIEAARALTYATAKMIDKNEKNYSKESAMCKLFASDTAMFVTTEAIQIYGGHGYMREYPVEKYFRDAKITQIYEGTNEIQKNVIANEALREARKNRKKTN